MGPGGGAVPSTQWLICPGVNVTVVNCGIMQASDIIDPTQSTAVLS